MPEHHNVTSQADLISVNFHIIHQQRPTRGHYDDFYATDLTDTIRPVNICSRFNSTECPTQVYNYKKYWRSDTTVTTYAQYTHHSRKRKWKKLIRTSTSTSLMCSTLPFKRPSKRTTLFFCSVFTSYNSFAHTSHNRCFEITVKFRDCDRKSCPSPFCTYFIWFRPNAHKTNVETW
jgi:hypothetical protein